MSETSDVRRGRARVRLPPHPKSCDLSQLAQFCKTTSAPLAADLFCGAGGLSLGLQESGFRVVLGVDKRPEAIETHRAYFSGASVCADLRESKEVDRLCGVMDGIGLSLLAAGIPCQPFSRAGRSKLRSLLKEGGHRQDDGRRRLWQVFVAIVGRVKPPAVLIENVPEIVLGADASTFRGIIVSLESLGYDVFARILPSWRYGIPQHRQRIFIVALGKGFRFDWPPFTADAPTTVRDAISDLPVLQGGEGSLELEYSKATSEYQSISRRGSDGEGSRKLHDHYARRVRDDDVQAFRLMDEDTRYSDLPEELRRYRSDIFVDKYKRLGWDNVSRTIIAHLARDGYWYIHPEQHRSLTVREAARIQSFPDWYRFAGTMGQAFRQIGEAVPPLLAGLLGGALLESLETERTERGRPSTTQLAESLVEWVKRLPKRDVPAPWRRAGSMWHSLMGAILFESTSFRFKTTLWSSLSERWPTPDAFLSDALRESALRAMGNRDLVDTMDGVASQLRNNPEEFDPRRLSVPSSKIQRMVRAYAASGRFESGQITAASLRVTERVRGESAEGSGVQARLLLSRLTGIDAGGLASTAVQDIGDRFCHPEEPECDRCPLEVTCLWNLARSRTRPNMSRSAGLRAASVEAKTN